MKNPVETIKTNILCTKYPIFRILAYFFVFIVNIVILFQTILPVELVFKIFQRCWECSLYLFLYWDHVAIKQKLLLHMTIWHKGLNGLLVYKYLWPKKSLYTKGHLTLCVVLSYVTLCLFNSNMIPIKKMC